MEFVKLLAFLCVASCCAFAYTMIEYKVAPVNKGRERSGTGWWWLLSFPYFR